MSNVPAEAGSSPRRAPDPAEIARRIWAKDASLWSDDPAVQAQILNRLGWLDLPTRMRAEVPAIRAFAEEIRAEGFTQALVLGMGGSSLCVEVFANAIGTQPVWLDVRICDTTVPADVLEATAWAERAKTLFIVSSKSGTTVETTSLYRHFRARVDDGARYVAITDPGSALEALASAERFRKVFAHPADVGGRYAALSPVGLVPAALLGVELGAGLDGAQAAAWTTRQPSAVGGDANPVLLAHTLVGIRTVAIAVDGRDSWLAPLGVWIEQLVAESTGKRARGMVAFPDFGAAVPVGFPEDPLRRRILRSRLESTSPSTHDERARVLFARMFEWEWLAALLSAFLGENAFDEPDVRSAKERTGTLLERWAHDRRLAEAPPCSSPPGLRAWTDSALRPVVSPLLQDLLRSHLARLQATDVAVLLAFLPRRPNIESSVAGLRAAIRDHHQVAATINWGPRYLHSTGQFWKGGPDIGVFLMLTADDPVDVPIPGAPYSFGTLCRAQALGDFEALVERGRRVLRVHLGSDISGGLARLTEIVASA